MKNIFDKTKRSKKSLVYLKRGKWLLKVLLLVETQNLVKNSGIKPFPEIYNKIYIFLLILIIVLLKIFHKSKVKIDKTYYEETFTNMYSPHLDIVLLVYL